MSHLAAVAHAKGQPFSLQPRPTPTPGPDELLLAVKSVALNPADVLMRAHGLFIPAYPTVTGFDMAGVVLEVGSNVPTDDNPGQGPCFKRGSRVAAYAASVWKGCDPDYGAFQERCLVPWQHALLLPKEISWNEAATLPVAGEVPLNAWDALGVPRVGEVPASSSSFPSSSSSARSKTKTNALLIWGASSSVGSMGVQSARVLRDDPGSAIAAVYATAGVANHQYVSELGADRVFDYSEEQVAEAIVAAAREDGVVIRHCFLATGGLAGCQAVLKAFVGDGQGSEKAKAKVASAPVIPVDAEEVNGVDTVFVVPAEDEDERLEQFRYWMGWMRRYLADGSVRPSPGARAVGRGLESVDAGLDELAKGVSCVKLVVEVDA
ncbi:GroES-like protein [Aspergillus aurantiobrunneus]